MDNDPRKRSGPPPYAAQVPMYRPVASPSPSQPSSSPATRPVHGHAAAVPPFVRASPHHQASTHSASSGLGIKVAVKPEYRITPPPRLSPNAGDIPRSNFQFDFELERKILAEAEEESTNWSRFAMENLPNKGSESTSQVAPVSNPIVSKYIALGLSREAVPIAVAHYGDNPTKIQEFVTGYTLLREMGFSSSAVADALVMHENNSDKALARFLFGST